jgi:hypothetical protein
MAVAVAVAAVDARMAVGVTLLLMMLAIAWVMMAVMNATTTAETEALEVVDPKQTRTNPNKPKQTQRLGVIRGSSQGHNKKMVLCKRKGISLDGITIIILLTFLPHTLKFQNPRFCGVSLVANPQRVYVKFFSTYCDTQHFTGYTTLVHAYFCNSCCTNCCE